MAELAVVAENLSKHFPPSVKAVDGLNLSIEQGTVYGLLGRNGAGKTTTLRMLMGLLTPTEGHSRLLGEDYWTAPRAHRARVSYVSQSTKLHQWMSATELCYYCSHFYDKWDSDYAQKLIKTFNLPQNRPIKTLSGGEQRKVAIMLALAARPELIILDEPAAGLDPIARRELIDALVDILAVYQETTVLFSTHIISDVERIAEHVGFMTEGKLTLSTRLDELQSQSKRVQIIFPEDKTPPPDFQISGAIKTDISGGVVNAVVRHKDESALDALRAEEGVRVETFPLSLEDIFIEMLGNAHSPNAEDAKGDTNASKN